MIASGEADTQMPNSQHQLNSRPVFLQQLLLVSAARYPDNGRRAWLVVSLL